MEHCADNGADRALGEYWEREFCRMAAGLGLSFTPMQIGRKASAQAYLQASTKWRHYTLPDVTVWTHPGQHHEIKHKDPTARNTYGLEVYRFEALMWFAGETEQAVLYTIHNHALSGGREGRLNRIEHWFTVDVRKLNGAWSSQGHVFSYVNGKKRRVPIYYWPMRLWAPLQEYWRVPEAA